MKLLQTFSLLAFCLLAGCSDKNSANTAATTNAPGTSALHAPADYAAGLANAQKKAVMTTDMVSITQAIQAFNAGEGRFPKDLNELVTSKYLPRLPEAPTGAKFDYDPNTGAVKLVTE